MCGLVNESFHFGIRKRSLILTIGSCVIQQNNYDKYAEVTLIIPTEKNRNAFCVRVHYRNRRFVANRILLIEQKEIQMLRIGYTNYSGLSFSNGSGLKIVFMARG